MWLPQATPAALDSMHLNIKHVYVVYKILLTVYAIMEGTCTCTCKCLTSTQAMS